MTLRQRIEKEAKIVVDAEQDDARVRGNAMASGDDDLDRQVEDKIIDRLDRGDVWAWAQVTVRATWRGLEAKEYLGCCCYEDEEDFRKNSGYFDDMMNTVIGELVSMAEEIGDVVSQEA